MYQYFISNYFKKQIKFYLKKHRNLLDELIKVLKDFQKENCVALGSNTYKIRLKTRDLSKGKSHSFRLVVLLIEVEKMITPLVVYFKGKKSNITKKEIIHHASEVRREL